MTVCAVFQCFPGFYRRYDFLSKFFLFFNFPLQQHLSWYFVLRGNDSKTLVKQDSSAQRGRTNEHWYLCQPLSLKTLCTEDKQQQKHQHIFRLQSYFPRRRNSRSRNKKENAFLSASQCLLKWHIRRVVEVN